MAHNSNSISLFAEMQKYALTLLLLLISAFAVNGQKNAYFEKLEERNGVYYLDNKPFTGRSMVFYDTVRTPKIEIYWKDGLMDGTKTTFYKKNKVKQKMEFVKGNRHGEYQVFYENGKLKEQGYYKDDFLEGKVESFYPNGRPKFIYNYKNGYQIGWNYMFFDNGSLEQKAFINEKGWLDSTFKSYYPEGNPLKEIEYSNGKYNGIYKEWFADGTLSYEGQYKMGMKEGEHKTYETLVGVLLKIESYKNNLKDGTWVTYGLEGDTTSMKTYVNDTLDGYSVDFIEGEIENEGNYVMGIKDGFWKQNLVTRIGAQEGTYDMGVKVGEWNLFDIKGNWLATITFDDEGEIIDEYWYGMKKRKKKKK